MPYRNQNYMTNKLIKQEVDKNQKGYVPPVEETPNTDDPNTKTPNTENPNNTETPNTEDPNNTETPDENDSNTDTNINNPDEPMNPTEE